MRLLLILILSVFSYAQGIPGIGGLGMVHNHVSGTTLLGTGAIGGNATETTSPNVDSTGGSIIFGATTSAGQPTTSAVTDSQSNSLVGPSVLAFGSQSGLNAGLFFSPSPSTSSTHSLTCACTGFFSSVWFAAFSGTTMSYQGNWSIGATYAADDVVLDLVDGLPYMSIAGGNIGNVPRLSAGQWRVMMAIASNASTQTKQAGSLTPLHNNALIISLVSTGATTGTLTVDSGFTQIGTVSLGVANAVSGSLSYLHQGTASAIDPIWTITASANVMIVVNLWVNGT